MPKKSLKVDRQQFEGIVRNMLQAKPVKREDVRVAKKKPAKLLPASNTLPAELPGTMSLYEKESREAEAILRAERAKKRKRRNLRS